MAIYELSSVYEVMRRSTGRPPIVSSRSWDPQPAIHAKSWEEQDAASSEGDSSSLDESEQLPSLPKLALALSDPSVTLNSDEQILYDVIQSKIQQARTDAILSVSKDYNDEKYRELQKAENEEQEKAMKAMQRLLAQVTAERDQLKKYCDQDKIKEQEERIQQLEQQVVNGSLMPSDSQIAKELAMRTNDLKNAKMIIASLENASGSLALDMRAKIKQKDEELAHSKATVAEKQRQLDTLAKDLRALQDKQAVTDQRLHKDHIRRWKLASKLEKHLADIRSCAVVLESSNDPDSLSKLMQVLQLAATTLRQGITQETSRRSDQSADKPDQVRRLEAELTRSQDEVRRLRHNITRNEDTILLQKELEALREQYRMNVEVLARKERELVVLRDSLNMDEDDGGYISDDVSEADEEVSAIIPGHSPLHSTPISPNRYGPSQAEALATLMVHGSGQTVTPSNDEFESLRSELSSLREEYKKAQVELKNEKDSLANAKMLIASIERSNGKMVEDLRNRLDDSNTAISSLLGKSLESDKLIASLKEQVVSLKREKEEFESSRTMTPPLALTISPYSTSGLTDSPYSTSDEIPETID